jgi:hypothetical protein
VSPESLIRALRDHVSYRAILAQGCADRGPLLIAGWERSHDVERLAVHELRVTAIRLPLRRCTDDAGDLFPGGVQRASAFSTLGFTSPIISSIERIAALCGVLPTLNEKQMCSGFVAPISATSFWAMLSASPIRRFS